MPVSSVDIDLSEIGFTDGEAWIGFTARTTLLLFSKQDIFSFKFDRALTNKGETTVVQNGKIIRTKPVTAVKIWESVFSIQTRDSCGSKIIRTKPVTAGKIWESVFSIQTRDSCGSKKKTGGDLLDIKISQLPDILDEKDESFMEPLSIVDTKTGEYDVTFQWKEKGKYFVYIEDEIGDYYIAGNVYVS